MQGKGMERKQARNYDFQKLRAMEAHCQPLVDIMVEAADTSEAEKLDKPHFEVVPFSLGIGRNQTSH